MCGITGKISLTKEKKITLAEIQAMNKIIKHRGPDDEGVYVNPQQTVGLGHRRLSIIDLSPLGHNPMCNEDGTVWIVFNGEIYNFQELRHDLIKRGHKFKSNTDTEVIIHLWEEYAENCLQYLRGMFAFAIWDENRKKLFLARDRVGKKPLKYYIGKNFFVFASELKAFIHDPDVPCQMDIEAIHLYLSFQYTPHPKTGFNDIKKLPQAHYLLIDLSGKTPKISEPIRYWKPNYSHIDFLTESEWKEKILEKFNECVQMRMVADVPFGAMLSGGVDSSAVVALMAQHSSRSVKTFSIGFQEDKFNELSYARIIAKKYETDHHEYIVEPNALEILPKLIFHYEEPYADSSNLPTYFLSQTIREHVTVALSGDGGDENFAGYNNYRALLPWQHYRNLPFWIRNIFYNFCKYSPIRPDSRFFQSILTLLNPDVQSVAELHTLLYAYFTPDEKTELYTDDFWASIERIDPTEYHARYTESTFEKNSLTQGISLDVQTYLPDDLLVKMDIAAMSNSLEVRSPLLDHEFIELTARIPTKLKVHHGSGKYIFKEALRSLLPTEILDRKKHGFSIPLDTWFQGSFLHYAKKIFQEDTYLIGTVFKRKSLEKLFETTKPDGRKIWSLLCLILWANHFRPKL